MSADLAVAIRDQLTKHGSLQFAGLIWHLDDAGVRYPDEQTVHDELERLVGSGAVGRKFRRREYCGSEDVRDVILGLAFFFSLVASFVFPLFALFNVGGTAINVEGSANLPSYEADAEPSQSFVLFRSTAFFATEHYPPDEHTVERYRRQVLQQDPPKKERPGNRSGAEPPR